MTHIKSTSAKKSDFRHGVAEGMMKSIKYTGGTGLASMGLGMAFAAAGAVQPANAAFLVLGSCSISSFASMVGGWVLNPNARLLHSYESDMGKIAGHAFSAVLAVAAGLSLANLAESAQRDAGVAHSETAVISRAPR